MVEFFARPDNIPRRPRPGKQPPVNDSVAKKMRQFMTGLRKYVQDNADYVGRKFPEEARKIHYEEAPSRGIHGEATAEEAKALSEEGIEFYPLPILPEDQN